LLKVGKLVQVQTSMRSVAQLPQGLVPLNIAAVMAELPQLGLRPITEAAAEDRLDRLVQVKRVGMVTIVPQSAVAVVAAVRTAGHRRLAVSAQ